MFVLPATSRDLPLLLHVLHVRPTITPSLIHPPLAVRVPHLPRPPRGPHFAHVLSVLQAVYVVIFLTSCRYWTLNYFTGSVLNNDSSSCVLCPSGSYFSLSNQTTSCKPCAAGTFASSPGSQFCGLCPLNTFSGDGASICQLCPRYSSSPAASALCTCDAGRLLYEMIWCFCF